MDLELTSQVAILISLLWLTNLAYKKTDWGARGHWEWKRNSFVKLNDYLIRIFNKRLEDFLIFIYVILFGIPIAASIIILVILFFKGGANLLESRGYWDQIFIIYSFICLFFGVNVFFDSIRQKTNEKKDLIEHLQKKIKDLEKKIENSEK